MKTRVNQISAALQRKFGPLPAWAWALILGVGLYVYRSRSSAGLKAAAATPTTDPGTVPATPAQPGAPVTLGPGESVYDPGTGHLTSTAPDQQPGQTPDPQPPIILQPGESWVDPGTGEIHTAPSGSGTNGTKAPPKAKPKPAGKTPGKKAPVTKVPRSKAQMRKDNPSLVARGKARILAKRKQHQPTQTAPHPNATKPVRPRQGGSVTPQPNPHQVGTGGAPAPGSGASAAPKNRTVVRAIIPAAPRAIAASHSPVAVIAAPMRQRPAAPTVKAPAKPPPPPPKPKKRK